MWWLSLCDGGSASRRSARAGGAGALFGLFTGSAGPPSVAFRGRWIILFFFLSKGRWIIHGSSWSMQAGPSGGWNQTGLRFARAQRKLKPSHLSSFSSPTAAASARSAADGRERASAAGVIGTYHSAAGR